MPTLFDDAWSMAAGVVDAHFGEAFELIPVERPLPIQPGEIVDSNRRTTRDTTRPPIFFVGIWGLKAVERFPDSRGHSSSDAHAFTGAVVTLEFEAASVPVTPQARDRVRRLKDGTIYEIVDPGDDVVGRRTLKLTAKRG